MSSHLIRFSFGSHRLRLLLKLLFIFFLSFRCSFIISVVQMVLANWYGTNYGANSNGAPPGYLTATTSALRFLKSSVKNIKHYSKYRLVCSSKLMWMTGPRASSLSNMVHFF
jgi:hypothetical protein